MLGAILTDEVHLGSDTHAYLNGIFALVFDNQTGDVVWYGAQPCQYKKNPVDPASLTKQLTALFKAFR